MSYMKVAWCRRCGIGLKTCFHPVIDKDTYTTGICNRNNIQIRIIIDVSPLNINSAIHSKIFPYKCKVISAVILINSISSLKM